MQRINPPYRADHVGSLLRPAALKEARIKRARGEITADALEAIEDREIEKAIPPVLVESGFSRRV